MMLVYNEVDTLDALRCVGINHTRNKISMIGHMLDFKRGMVVNYDAFWRAAVWSGGSWSRRIYASLTMRSGASPLRAELHLLNVKD